MQRLGKGHFPKVDPTVFAASDTVVIGDVTVYEQSSIWFYFVVPGDISPIVNYER